MIYTVKFSLDISGNSNEFYAQIKAFASDATAGDEGGK